MWPGPLWTASQRRALIALTAVAAAGLGIERYNLPTMIPIPPPSRGPRAGEVSGQIDPNTATAAMLATLPRLGRKEAEALVMYRDGFAVAHPHELAFKRPADLMKIKGIGAATEEKLTPYLSFSDPAPRPK